MKDADKRAGEFLAQDKVDIGATWDKLAPELQKIDQSQFFDKQKFPTIEGQLKILSDLEAKTAKKMITDKFFEKKIVEKYLDEHPQTPKLPDAAARKELSDAVDAAQQALSKANADNDAAAAKKATKELTVANQHMKTKLVLWNKKIDLLASGRGASAELKNLLAEAPKSLDKMDDDQKEEVHSAMYTRIITDPVSRTVLAPNKLLEAAADARDKKNDDAQARHYIRCIEALMENWETSLKGNPAAAKKAKELKEDAHNLGDALPVGKKEAQGFGLNTHSEPSVASLNLPMKKSTTGKMV